MPTRAVLDHRIPVAAGSLTFVVESLQLTDEIAPTALRDDRLAEHEGRESLGLDDFGACLHTHGARSRATS